MLISRSKYYLKFHIALDLFRTSPSEIRPALEDKHITNHRYNTKSSIQTLLTSLNHAVEVLLQGWYYCHLACAPRTQSLVRLST
jgi:hypothetical protein